MILILSLAREKTGRGKSILLDCVEPLPLVEVAVKAWHGRRPMSVGTVAKTLSRSLVSASGLRRYFDAVVAADHVQHHKPAPDTFLTVRPADGRHADAVRGI